MKGCGIRAKSAKVGGVSLIRSVAVETFEQELCYIVIMWMHFLEIV